MAPSEHTRRQPRNRSEIEQQDVLAMKEEENKGELRLAPRTGAWSHLRWERQRLKRFCVLLESPTPCKAGQDIQESQ